MAYLRWSSEQSYYIYWLATNAKRPIEEKLAVHFAGEELPIYLDFSDVRKAAKVNWVWVQGLDINPLPPNVQLAIRTWYRDVEEHYAKKHEKNQ